MLTHQIYDPRVWKYEIDTNSKRKQKGWEIINDTK